MEIDNDSLRRYKRFNIIHKGLMLSDAIGTTIGALCGIYVGMLI